MAIFIFFFFFLIYKYKNSHIKRKKAEFFKIETGLIKMHSNNLLKNKYYILYYFKFFLILNTPV